MKFYKIKPGDEKQAVFASFNVAELKRMANALALDIAGDSAAGQATDAGKTALLERLKKLIPE